MLLDIIAQYYKILWFAFGAVAFIKIIISTIFHGSLEGLNGIFYALFKWYSEDEQEIEDVQSRRTTMRIHNFVTIILYILLALIFGATLLTVIL
jgi:uncharacterized protein YqhQ